MAACHRKRVKPTLANEVNNVVMLQQKKLTESVSDLKEIIKRQKVGDAERKQSHDPGSTMAESKPASTAEGDQRKRDVKGNEKSGNNSRRNSNLSVNAKFANLGIENNLPYVPLLQPPIPDPVNPLQ